MTDQTSRYPLSPEVRALRPGTLWKKIVDRSHQAIDCGAIQAIDTEQRCLEDHGVVFMLRVVSALTRKERERRTHQSKPVTERPNPFLPPEPALLVAAVSDTHLAVLNKFNVIDHHLLIVTHRFEHQETLLDEHDFDAWWRCLGEYPSLGFYNGGTVAGASQLHKHLQLVPLPLLNRGPRIPVEPLLPPTSPVGQIMVCDRLPFRHAFVRLDPQSMEPIELVSLYRELLAKSGIHATQRRGGIYQSGPYNLLIIREWMLLVPRRKECFDAVSINGLGFAGSLFVKNRQQARNIVLHGPMAVLRRVAFAV